MCPHNDFLRKTVTRADSWFNCNVSSLLMINHYSLQVRTAVFLPLWLDLKRREEDLCLTFWTMWTTINVSVASDRWKNSRTCCGDDWLAFDILNFVAVPLAIPDTDYFLFMEASSGGFRIVYLGDRLTVSKSNKVVVALIVVP